MMLRSDSQLEHYNAVVHRTTMAEARVAMLSR